MVDISDPLTEGKLGFKSINKLHAHRFSHLVFWYFILERPNKVRGEEMATWPNSEGMSS